MKTFQLSLQKAPGRSFTIQHAVFGFLALFLFLLAPYAANSEVLTIHSEQKLAAPSPTINTWTVSNYANKDRSAKVTYALDGVTYPRFNTQSVSRNLHKVDASTPLGDIIVLDSPQPSLPLSDQVMDGRTEYSIIREAGGMRFVRKLVPSVVTTTVEKAREKGLVRTNILESKATLLLYTFHDGSTNELVFTQLYSPDLQWWLYESAGPRTSWLTAVGE